MRAQAYARVCAIPFVPVRCRYRVGKPKYLPDKGKAMVNNPNNFNDVAKAASELITAIHHTRRSGDSNSQTLPDGLAGLLNHEGSLVADLAKLAEWCDDVYYAHAVASTK